LSAARGERVLFSDVSFTLHGGEALWVRGANGSGKTTLLRLLCGLGLPLAGQVRWCRQPIGQVREYFHRHALYVGHASGIKDDLLAWENVATAAALAGQRCSRAQAVRALEQIGLGPQAGLPARVLSQGQRRRVALARLYLEPLPSVLLLDEPFSALDQSAVERLCALLGRHLGSGGTLVYTTHQAVTLEAERVEELDLGIGTAC
jgi:heme exporter protein A